jgi:hypothetical protein
MRTGAGRFVPVIIKVYVPVPRELVQLRVPVVLPGKCVAVLLKEPEPPREFS